MCGLAFRIKAIPLSTVVILQARFTNLMDEAVRSRVDLNDMDIPYHYATVDTGVVAWFSTVKFNFSGFEDLNSLEDA